MNQEPQLTDRSDYLPLTPKELLRRSVLKLATQPVDSLEGQTVAVIKRGYRRLPGTRFLVAEIIAPTQRLSRNLQILLPECVLTLSVYTSGRDGYADSVTISGGTDGTVIGDIGGQEIDAMNPDEEDRFIQMFYNKYHLNDVLHLRATSRTT